MSHPKSCRCKLCCSSYPDCKTHECPPHWKNRFCKLRKKWSDHSKCGSVKLHPEDYTYCRSPCEKTVGRFGVAWVADLPNCDKEEPKGWQVEILDTMPGILKKYEELIEWLNNPPSHLFDSIEENAFCSKSRHPKCLNTCDEYFEEPCYMKSALYKCEGKRAKKKYRINSCEDKEEDECLPCNDSQISLNDNQNHKSVNCVSACKNKCCGGETTLSKPNDDSSDQEYSKPCQTNCHTYCPLEIFRRQSCSCQCEDKLFKDAATTYENENVPQKDFAHNTFISDLTEIDSNIICAGIRSSQICRKLKEEKRQQLMEKRERELNTMDTQKNSIDDVARSLYMSAEAENQSVMNNNLITNAPIGQRRSSKFRRKESG